MSCTFIWVLVLVVPRISHQTFFVLYRSRTIHVTVINAKKARRDGTDEMGCSLFFFSRFFFFKQMVDNHAFLVLCHLTERGTSS